jgi:hypothetical protein
VFSVSPPDAGGSTSLPDVAPMVGRRLTGSTLGDETVEIWTEINFDLDLDRCFWRLDLL